MYMDCMTNEEKSQISLKTSEAAKVYLASEKSKEDQVAFKKAIYELTAQIEGSLTKKIIKAKDFTSEKAQGQEVVKIYTSEHKALKTCYTSYILIDNIMFSSAIAGFAYLLEPNDLDYVAEILSCRKPEVILPDIVNTRFKDGLDSLPESARLSAMYTANLAKFTQDFNLKTVLETFKGKYIVEDNRNHDNYWGSCNCLRCRNTVSLNRLGEILMHIISEL